MTEKICSVEECGRGAKCAGMCWKHYYRLRKHGDPNVVTVLTDPLERFWAKVDKSGECWLWTAAMKENGYGAFMAPVSGQKHRYAHRFSFALEYGPIPDGMQVDHICHNRACVNPDHLRLATAKQNLENQGVLRSDNTSGYRGVSWDKKNKRWHASVMHNKKYIHLGRFLTIEEARDSAIAKRNELFTHNILDRKAS